MSNDLSKKKYIYRIYSSEDRIIHCERHPIIYINSVVCYYKDVRKQEYLSNKLVKGVEEEFTGVVLGYNGHYEKFFWKVEDFNSQKETENAYLLRNKTDLEIAKAEMERSEREFIQKKQKYDELLKQ